MKKAIILAMLFAGLGTTPAFAGPYVSGSFGVAIPGDREIEGGFVTKLDTSVALNGAVGYNFGSTRLEGALGYQRHDLSDIKDSDLSFLTVMANGYYDFNAASTIKPYVMTGAGVVSTDFTYLSGDHGAQTNFAWQLGAGVGIKATENITFDIGYRYLRTEGEKTSGGRYVPGLDINWDSHNIFAGVRYEF